MTDDKKRRKPPEGDESDFADEHTRPTYEDELDDSPAAPRDESVPDHPGGESDKPKGPL